MVIDICFVTYNSNKWIEDCVKSFFNANYDKGKISLYFTDNNSSDNTIEILERLKEKYNDSFANFEIIQTGKNLGFGAGSNISARAGRGDYVFFCNVDTKIHVNALNELAIAIEKYPNSRAFELRQFPYEHPKFYNPITMEVPFASGACFILKRDLFIQTGGFDETIFMYAEDVDLSWRIRALGEKIHYVPKSIIYHYSYSKPGEIKPIQFMGSIIGNWILRAKFGSDHDMKEWNAMKNNPVSILRKKYPKEYIIYTKLMKKAKKFKKEYRKFYNQQVRISEFIPDFYGFDYCFPRDGSFFKNYLPSLEKAPLFSIIIRTFNRPEMLKMCLKSLENQTYTNFEVIVCEDGVTPLAEYVIDMFKKKLNIKYFAMRKSAGRCLTGNKGLELSRGDFINFLDDDDYFFPEHLEVLASQIEKKPGIKMFVTNSVHMHLDSVISENYNINPKELFNFTRKEIQLIDILQDNQMPIQAVTFHKSLPAEVGGFDNTFIRSYEDWDLWIRFMMITDVYVIQ